jgi:hypothetical protein
MCGVFGREARWNAISKRVAKQEMRLGRIRSCDGGQYTSRNRNMRFSSSFPKGMGLRRFDNIVLGDADPPCLINFTRWFGVVQT